MGGGGGGAVKRHFWKRKKKEGSLNNEEKEAEKVNPILRFGSRNGDCWLVVEALSLSFLWWASIAA